MSSPYKQLADMAASRYADPYSRNFARGKLRFDPVYAALLRSGRLPDHGSVLDLGCGQGLLLSLLAARCGSDAADSSRLALRGFEIDVGRADIARRALGSAASVTACDMRDAEYPASSAVVLLDALLYLPAADQRKVLGRACEALEPGGTLIVREADASAGAGFRVTRWAERLLEIGRGYVRDRLHYRSRDEWVALLTELGLTVASEPMSAGTPFANFLYFCRKRG